MPTMSAIRMHPALRNRLANLNGIPPRPADDEDVSISFRSVRPASNNDNEPSTNDNGTVENRPRADIPSKSINKPVSMANIHTPQALLSRDPTQITSGITESTNNAPNLPLEAVLNLRASVADALIMDEHCGHGMECEDVRNRVSSSISEMERKWNENLLHRASRSGGSVGKEVRIRIRHPPPLVAGSVTALDLCILSSTLDNGPAVTSPRRHDGTAISTLRTGSLKLDKLLAPPVELSRGGSACRIYHSSLLERTPAGIAAAHGNHGYFGDEAHPAIPEGVLFGIVTEVWGRSAVGKTQLACSLSVTASMNGMSVHYLAAGGGNAVLPIAKRISRICQERLSRSDATTSPADRSRLVKEALSRIRLTTASDGYRTLAALAEIDVPPPPVTPGGSPVREKCLIVFDGASGCLSPNFLTRDDGNAGADLVSEVGLTLRRLARTRGHAVFVANGAAGRFHGTDDENADAALPSVRPAMGGVWRAADVRLFLESVGGGGDPPEEAKRGLRVFGMKKIRATVDRHYAKSCHSTKRLASAVVFGIESRGIVDVS